MNNEQRAPATDSTATSAAGDLNGLEGVYRLQPERSAAEFRGRAWKAVWVSGTISDLLGEIAISPQGVSATGTAQAASVATGMAVRDRHLRSRDYLWARRHPTVEMEVRGASRVAPELEARLTARGASTTATLTIEEFARDGDELRVRAAGRFDRSPLHMRTPLLGVGRIVEIRLVLVAVRRGAASIADV